MDNRYEIAEQNGMSREFADWFFDNKKAGCGNVWFMMMAAMWEGWQGRAAMLQGAKPVTTAYKLPAIGWLRADYQDDNRGMRGNAPLFVFGKKDPSSVWGLDYIPLTAKSPVVLDGACPCCGRKQLKNRTCSVSGCDGKHVARGFCIKHYAIERKKDPSRRESIRAADKRYRARKAAAPQQEVK
ncbi:TPA: hypothetical protein KFU04_001046 [Escherichia coli]|nr:hypothetical protein [Escherichia coli]